jgi:proline iminopeptidase
MDQRGVLRSDPLGEAEPFGLEDLIEDCEAVRRALGVERWAVIGHSFGGYLAVRYALKYPSVVTAVILESPTLDLGSSARSLLRRAAAEYRLLGRTTEAAVCLTAAAAPTTSEQVWAEFTRLSNSLGPARNNLYVYGPEKGFFDDLVTESPIPSEWWRRQNVFQQRLYAEKRVFESLLSALPLLAPPALIIKGRYDPVAADDQIDAFRRSVTGGRVVEFERSGHFVHVEEADRFARTVLEFLSSTRTR